MTLSSEYIKIINKISEMASIPLIRDIIVPSNNNNSKSSNFAAIVLEDNSIGIFFIGLSPEIKSSILRMDHKVFYGIEPSIMAQKFLSKSQI